MNARIRLALLAVLGIALGLAVPSQACTTFCLRDDGRVLFGKNYDWEVGEGLLVVNQRGVARKADVENDRPASWVSRYGSVTFNQYGRDFPSGGMNEAGLVIELMMLQGSRYPTPDQRPALDILQWIQYNLDTHATVAEVLAADQKVRIAGDVPLHYLVADRKGQVASVEFLDGRMVAHTGKDLPVAALTNSTYEVSEKSRQETKARHLAPPDGTASVARFQRAAERVDAFHSQKGDAVAYAFDTLDQVAQGTYTQWSIVYEIDRLRVHFRTRDLRPVRTLSLGDLDFACGRPVRVLRLDARIQGDVARALVPYTRQINYDLVHAAFSKTSFLASVPDAEVQRVAAYPEADACRR
ncbi:MAG TPA: linear amide C-N hydrolase [Thermoanaerobaculia bacterium]|nr:linear amide C-N hydrolase [Thermoanaerobaculia bacterium]